MSDVMGLHMKTGSLSLLAFISLGLGVCAGATYWVSPTGQAAWLAAQSVTPLNGAVACSLSTANANAAAGDIIYLRGGTYTGLKIQPAKSGTSDSSRIVFTNFNHETVLLRDSTDGIYIYKKSYITVNGINFYNLRRFMRIYAGHHNTISYCNFDQRSPESGEWVGALIADDYNDNTSASENSTHNWIHHCSFYRFVYGTYAEHRGGLLDIGSSDETALEDESYYNVIEDSTFAYGGHHTIGVYSKFNVIRNNYFHNETNPANWAFEGYRAALTEGPFAGFCLYEGNRFGYAGASGLALRSARNILRFNSFYQSGSGAIQVVSNTANVDHADFNHIYRNSFYHNGYLATYINFQGGMYFSSWSGVSPHGNVIKSNIFFANQNGSIRYDGVVEGQIIANNWDQNSVDPGFVDLSGSDPNDANLPDLHLKANSQCIDAGTSLTTVTSASGSGTAFQVADAGYFFDGWGISSVVGDMIQLLGSSERARVVTIDYATNTLTFNRALTWVQGQGIALAYEGTAPDIGAFEFVPITPTGYYPLTPCRAFDTRNAGGVDGAAPVLAAGERRLLVFTGKCGLPANVLAISANVTVVGAIGIGDLRVTGGHMTSTPTSVLSIPLARARANNAILQLPTYGSETIAVTNDSPGTVHFILDVNGFFQ